MGLEPRDVRIFTLRRVMRVNIYMQKLLLQTYAHCSAVGAMSEETININGNFFMVVLPGKQVTKM
jgi:hypothetical protein